MFSAHLTGMCSTLHTTKPETIPALRHQLDWKKEILTYWEVDSRSIPRTQNDYVSRIPFNTTKASRNGIVVLLIATHQTVCQSVHKAANNDFLRNLSHFKGDRFIPREQGLSCQARGGKRDLSIIASTRERKIMTSPPPPFFMCLPVIIAVMSTLV
ncbi:hypothetical protein TNCV_3583771 [Trichonephila clavipes]|nr:hypothetical protein TNCV_3583771 [Trichonephila clavipes]